MKLSEAIRLGAMLRPQGTHELFPGEASCALGAAMEAVGLRDKCLAYRTEYDCDPYDLVRKTFPFLNLFPGRNPISLRNDGGQSREQIAGWVESIERESGMIPQAEQVSELVST